MIICDIDGTLFDNHHRKHLIPDIKTFNSNWHYFNSQHVNDEPVRHVIAMVSGMARNEQLTFLTSRNEKFRDSTLVQIERAFKIFGLLDCELVMRSNDDDRDTLHYKHDQLTWFSQTGMYGPNVFIDDNEIMINHVNQAFPHYDTVLVSSKDCTLI
jgi:hypothetical protein